MEISRRKVLAGAGTAVAVVGMPAGVQAIKPPLDEEAKSNFREAKIQEIAEGLDRMQNNLEALDALLEKLARRAGP